MQDRPTVDELLDAVAAFLHGDVMPHTTGRLSFHARVAGNLLQMLRRELSGEEDHLEREWAGLNALLGERAHPQTLSGLRAAILERNEELCRRIHDGEADQGAMRTAVLSHLREVLRSTLSVSDPGLLAQG
ncbi:MAG TPA: hypothetical protein DEV93_18400 [Chloroflexi bacterium]|jgi:DNA-directed RNA polymerase sigma subunit (sigma70/sigma32)|nr:hypothetical protein [Chloroflexota bacterium]